MRPATRTRPGAPGTASSPRPNGSRASRRAELLSPTCAQQGEAAELPAEQSSYLPFEGVSRHEAVNEYPLGNGSQGAEPTPSAVQAPRASERLNDEPGFLVDPLLYHGNSRSPRLDTPRHASASGVRDARPPIDAAAARLRIAPSGLAAVARCSAGTGAVAVAAVAAVATSAAACSC